MDGELKRHAEAAIREIEVVLRHGPQAEHAEIRAASNAVIALRDRAIERHRAGAVDRSLLDRTNALVSLAYGAEFPLIGLHLDRLEQTRDGVRALLESGGQRDGTGAS